MLGVGRQAGTIRHELSCISTLHLNWDTGLVFVQGHNYQETALTALIALHRSAQRSDRKEYKPIIEGFLGLSGEVLSKIGVTDAIPAESL